MNAETKRSKATTLIPTPQILAEVLRLQRWAGGESVSSARIFGLMHGFESVIDQERESFGISRELQRQVEDIIDDVDKGKQSAGGFEIKQRLIRDRIDESVASTVIELCRLQGRFPDAIEKLTADDSHFSHLQISRSAEQSWIGSLHYMELIDCTEDVHEKMHACFSPTVPRIGEVVTPESGSTMRVVDVEYIAVTQGKREDQRHKILIPYVYLEEETDDGQRNQ